LVGSGKNSLLFYILTLSQNTFGLTTVPQKDNEENISHDFSKTFFFQHFYQTYPKKSL